jgi:hypothetical protein
MFLLLLLRCAFHPALLFRSAIQRAKSLLLYPHKPAYMCRSFSHRFNDRVNTIDSICLDCFKTIATATHEADLDEAEKRHSCVAEDRLRLDLFVEAATIYFRQDKRV